MRAQSGQRNRQFDRFWLGNSVSQFGDRISELAIPLIAVVLLHTDPAESATLVALIWLPNVLSPLVGTWVDTRRDKRQLLIAADLLRAAVLLSVPAAALLGHVTLGQLYVVAALIGIGQMLFNVTYPAFFIALVPRSDYVAANSKLSTTRSASYIAGPAVGGALIQAITAPLAVFVDAVTFLFSAFSIGRVKVTGSEPVADTSTSLGRRLLAGLRFNFGHRIVRACLACSTTMNFFMYMGQALVLLFASRALGLSAGEIGIGLGAGAAGGLLSAVVAKKVIDRIGLGRSMVVGAICYPAPFVLLGIAGGPHWLGVGVLAAVECLSGMGVMLYDIGNNSLKSAVIPAEMRSRAAGAYSAINYGSRPLGALVGGWLGTVVGLRPTLITAALGGVLGCLWLLASPIARLTTIPEPGDPVVADAQES
ncbi:MFS transporter [Amycolatopsis sp. NPDC051758]|uniref:MFS transporter n=1 Tax=Amycolatopsis sp. NPDC051758 TaxID=3363935 RepID=UPI00378B3DC3